MKNQFFYTEERDVSVKNDNGETTVIKQSLVHSFSISKVLRSMAQENGQRIVILNDLHEQWTTVPQLGKNGKIASYKREKDVFQSEIILDEKDSKRFIEILSITD